MSDRMTEIHLPLSSVSVEIADYGEVDAPNMIKQFRSYSAQLRKKADLIDAAADHEFQVSTYIGVHVQRKRRVIQHSSRIIKSDGHEK